MVPGRIAAALECTHARYFWITGSSDRCLRLRAPACQEGVHGAMSASVHRVY